MARYNEILVGRFARGVQKLFGVKGEVPTGSIAGEITVTHNLFSGAENRYLEGWDRYGIYNTITAGGAGNDSVAQLRNPAASNLIVVVEKLSIMFSLADNAPIRMATINTDLATILSGVAIDSRGRPNSTAVYSSKNNSAAVGAGSSFMQASGSAAFTTYEVITDENQEIPISPGNALTITATTLNTRIDIAILWRERFLEESERT